MRLAVFVLFSVFCHALWVSALTKQKAKSAHSPSVVTLKPGLLDEPAPTPPAPKPKPAPATPVATPKPKSKVSKAIAKIAKKQKIQVLNMDKALVQPGSGTEDILIPVKEAPPIGVEAALDAADVTAAAVTPSKNETAEEETETAAGTAAVPTGTEPVDVSEVQQAGGNVPPEYPLAARQQKHQGTVDLLYLVSRDGAVHNVKIVKSCGYEELDQEAIKAISNYRFIPGHQTWTSHSVSFSLKE